MTTTLRTANEGDAALLAELGGRLFAQAFGDDNDPADLASHIEREYSVEALRGALTDPGRAAWIAEDAGVVVGYALLRREARGTGVVGDHPAEVQRIYVNRSLHGRGVGEALMRACIDEARRWGADTLWLGVWERNPRAIAFYAKSGFRVVGRHPFQLGKDLQTDLVMSRPLATVSPAGASR